MTSLWHWEDFDFMRVLTDLFNTYVCYTMYCPIIKATYYVVFRLGIGISRIPRTCALTGGDVLRPNKETRHHFATIQSLNARFRLSPELGH